MRANRYIVRKMPTIVRVLEIQPVVGITLGGEVALPRRQSNVGRIARAVKLLNRASTLFTATKNGRSYSIDVASIHLCHITFYLYGPVFATFTFDQVRQGVVNTAEFVRMTELFMPTNLTEGLGPMMCDGAFPPGSEGVLFSHVDLVAILWLLTIFKKWKFAASGSLGAATISGLTHETQSNMSHILLLSFQDNTINISSAGPGSHIQFENNCTTPAEVYACIKTIEARF